MRIGIDIMGGDFAPLEALKGCLDAKGQLPDAEIILFGDREKIYATYDELGAGRDSFELVHAPDVIGMGEHPTKAISQKRESSIAVGFQHLKDKHIDGFVGAGNTGAMMVGAMFSVKAIEGVLRPTITSVLPKATGGLGVLLDVGANADCRPDVLCQFGTLGSLFCQHIYKIENPRVGLLNIGEEKEKGNLITREAFQLMEESSSFNFVGNAEGRDLFVDKIDVAVCDGFTGNIVLKACESLYYILKKRGVQDEFLDRFNYENYGGTPILGVNAPVIIGHGISRAKSFVAMLRLAREMSHSGLIEHIKSSLNTLV